MGETNDNEKVEKNEDTNATLKQGDIEGIVDKALEKFNSGKDEKSKEKAPELTKENVSDIVKSAIESVTPILAKNITEEATKSASDTFKKQHYGEIEKLNEQVKTLTDAKTAVDDAAKETATKQQQEDYSKLDDTNKTKFDVQQMQNAFAGQMKQVSDALGQITGRLNTNDMNAYRNGIIEANKDQIIPELVRGNSVEELNISLEDAKRVYQAQQANFANQLGIKPEQLKDVISNIQKVTQSGGTPTGTEIKLPTNSAQNTESSSTEKGEVNTPKSLDDYKKNRSEYMKEAAKASEQM